MCKGRELTFIVVILNSYGAITRYLKYHFVALIRPHWVVRNSNDSYVQSWVKVSYLIRAYSNQCYC